MLSFDMIIDGQAVSSANKGQVINPATGEVFAEYSLGNKEYVDQAVQSARKAFESWSQVSDDERKETVLKLAGILEQNMPELMQLVTQESGKPMGGLNGIGSGMEVGGAIAWSQVTAALELPVETIQDDEQALVEVHRKPLGVVASITPWNWPLMIAVWHIMPALRTGNTVVIKPSELTPAATLRFVELANEVLPKGVLNIVPGAGDVGSAITSHTGINKIVFTGSTPTGRKIMQSAASNLKRLTLELGGNDAGIILPDVDVNEVAPKIFGMAFHNNGQTCAALKRLYVHESQYDDMCQALVNVANNVVVGNGLEENTELGPLQNKQQLDIVKDLAEDARANGGQFLTGGEQIGEAGYFYKPTIVAGLSNGHRLVDEEQFGPILPVIKYSSIDQAIELANDNENGLGGSVWSNDIEQAKALVQRLECGTAWVNEHGALQPNAPFGGAKQSGIGVEFGHYGMEEYTYIQTVKVAKA